MKFVSVEQLRSPVGQALWQWYAAHQQDGVWPPKGAFLPEHLPARVLPRVGLVDVEQEPFRVYYRLLGSAIAESFGRTRMQGYLDTLNLSQAEELESLYRHFLSANRPLFLSGVQRIDGRDFAYEGGALPLGDPQDAVRRFLIFEDYLNSEAWRSALRRRRYRTDPEPEAEAES